jgi:hypothetical protein
MIVRRQTLSWVGIFCLATLVFCNREPRAAKERKVDQSRIMEIVPGKSIGDAKLGMKVDELLLRAVINRPGGTLDDVQLLINDAGGVDDIWVDDVRTFPHRLRFQGIEIPKDATIESIQTIVGKCAQISGIKGGLFLNCDVGLALGTDFARETLQIRVKPISSSDSRPRTGH